MFLHCPKWLRLYRFGINGERDEEVSENRLEGAPAEPTERARLRYFDSRD